MEPNSACVYAPVFKTFGKKGKRGGGLKKIGCLKNLYLSGQYEADKCEQQVYYLNGSYDVEYVMKIFSKTEKEFHCENQGMAATSNCAMRMNVSLFSEGMFLIKNHENKEKYLNLLLQAPNNYKTIPGVKYINTSEQQRGGTICPHEYLVFEYDGKLFYAIGRYIYGYDNYGGIVFRKTSNKATKHGVPEKKKTDAKDNKATNVTHNCGCNPDGECECDCTGAEGGSDEEDRDEDVKERGPEVVEKVETTKEPEDSDDEEYEDYEEDEYEDEHNAAFKHEPGELVDGEIKGYMKYKYLKPLAKDLPLEGLALKDIMKHDYEYFFSLKVVDKATNELLIFGLYA